MLNDFKSSITKNKKKKIISPFSGTFFFAWFIWNWRMLYYLLFSDGSELEDKLDFVDSAFINLNSNLWYPLASTVFLILIYPLLTTGSLYVWLLYKKWQGNLRNRIEGSQLLTLEQSILLREEYKSINDRFASIAIDKDSQLKIKQTEIDTLTKKSESEIADLMRKIDEEKRANQTLTESVAQREFELREKSSEIERLTELLREERTKPAVSNGAQGRLEADTIKKLLSLPLTAANLQEYTSNKFRGLPVSTKLQSAILRNIDISKYPTIHDLDGAVDRAVPALVAYQLESPNMFEWGTDYISKALGFVDDNFRARHRFSNVSLAAFNRYGRLVKPPDGITETRYEEIPINDIWRLNHWGSSCARIVGEKMIFSGTSAPRSEDGSHIDLNNKLVIGNTYEISCSTKSAPNTTAMFRLWCHDETGASPHGVNVSTEFRTPATDDETVRLEFRAEFNKNIRIHLQYRPGQGEIEVSNVRIREIMADMGDTSVIALVPPKGVVGPMRRMGGLVSAEINVPSGSVEQEDTGKTPPAE